MHTPHKLIAFFLLLLLPLVKLNAQELPLNHITMQDGLSSSSVHSITQDHQGYLWFATENGVNRFDGNTFEHFSVDDGLGDNEIFRVFEDKYHRVWFLSFNGRLSYYQNGKIYNESNAPFLKEAFCGQSLISIAEVENNLWIGSNSDHLIMIDHEKIKNFSFRDSTFHFGGVSIFKNKSGNVMFRYSNRVYEYNNTTQQLYLKEFSQYACGYSRASLSENSDNFFVGRAGIVKISNSEDELIVESPENKTTHFFSCIFNEDNDDLWVGTIDTGVLQYKFIEGKYKLVQTHLPDIHVNFIFKDQEDNIWFCTNGDGAYMLTDANRNIKIYTKFHKYATTNLFSVFVDRKGTVWSGGDKGILSLLKNETGKIESIQLDFFDNKNFKIVDIAEDFEGNLWIATSNEIFMISPAGLILKLPASNHAISGARAAKSISVASEGDVFVAFYAGILKYNKLLKSMDLLPNQNYPTRTYFIHAVAGKIFVANIHGLCEYKDNRLASLYKEDARLTQRISHINHLKDSTIVLGTNGFGVYLYKNNKIVNVLNKESGLPSNEIRSIHINGNNVWIATDKGIAFSVYNRGRLKVRKLFQIQKKLASYDIKDIFLKDSLLYAATSNGLVVLNVNYFDSHHKPLTVFFTKFSANNLSYSLDTFNCLKHDQNNIVIAFRAISFGSPKLVEYQYRFGTENDYWKKTKNTEVLLTKLPPGKYNFMVRSRVMGEMWGPVAFIEFEIHKPFWDTLVFKISAVAISVLLISLPFVWLQKRKVRNKLIAMEKLAAINLERQRISYDLHDDLGSSLTSIGMNTEIVKHKLNQNLNFNRELRDIEESARYANEKMSDIIWAISVSNDHLPGLAAYINEFISDFENRCNLQITKKIQPDLPRLELSPYVRKNIFLTVKEAFHNILKHSKANIVNFELYISNEILNVIIHDNGSGFNQDKIDENSLGLASMKERINSVNGNLILLTGDGHGTTLIIRCNILKLNHTKA